MPKPRWICSPYDQVDKKSLYAILQLRAEVFVVEQDCAYQDLDGFDAEALHLCGWLGEALVCYARINAPGTKANETSISRVIVRQSHRGGGLGRLLMGEALAHCRRLWPGATVALAAQQYLEEFYASLGFRAVSAPYADAGIFHVDMLLEPSP